jgi:hypothetical protein
MEVDQLPIRELNIAVAVAEVADTMGAEVAAAAAG